MAEELTFHLEDFDGPLELLLALVAKHKMDLHNIPILQLIDQYTRTVEQADPDPEAASAFIEMAARLVEMKSYLLLPRSEEGERMKQEFTGQPTLNSAASPIFPVTAVGWLVIAIELDTLLFSKAYVVM